MENELQAISGVSDVSYLLRRLLLAKVKNETDVRDAILIRSKDIGPLKDKERAVEAPFRHLRAAVSDILGTYAY